MKIVVVGAGIGGLTAATALSRDGHDVAIIERARELTATGAGIGLWPNALRALAEIDLESPIRADAAPFTSTPILDRQGRTLSSFPADQVLRRLRAQPVIAHRADVQAALLHGASGIPLQLATSAVSVRQEAGRATVVTEGAGELKADLVVGADGISSVVAQGLGVAPPAALHLESWRAVFDSEQEVSDAWLSIGDGHQFLVTALPGGRLYIGGLVNDFDGSPPAKDFTSVRRAYAGWHDPIPALVDEMSVGGVRWDPVWHRKPLPTTVSGRVVIIGDAAHPMTPDLGQGGCQAIEDAISLAAALRAGPDVDTALRRYDAVRCRRSGRVVMTSYRMGELLSSPSPMFSAVRNRAMRLAPSAVMVRQVAAIAGVGAFERQLAQLGRAR